MSSFGTYDVRGVCEDVEEMPDSSRYVGRQGHPASGTGAGLRKEKPWCAPSQMHLGGAAGVHQAKGGIP